MKYCPHCDMEFIDEVEICTDCGRPLVDMETWQKEQEEQKKEARANARRSVAPGLWGIPGIPGGAASGRLPENPEDLEALPADDLPGGAPLPEAAEASAALNDGYAGVLPGIPADQKGAEGSSEEPLEEPEDPAEQLSEEQEEEEEQSLRPVRGFGNTVYVTRAERYEDLRSSASAFRLVGALLFILTLFCFGDILHLPFSLPANPMLRVMLPLLTAGAFYVSVKTTADAKKVQGQIKEEQDVTNSLREWFLATYTAEQVDEAVRKESREDLGKKPELLALKRMNYIQDCFITQYDLADQGYVDALSEDVYGRLFEPDGPEEPEEDDEESLEGTEEELERTAENEDFKETGLEETPGKTGSQNP